MVVVVVGCEDVPDELEGAELEEDGAHGLGRGFVFGAPWGVDGPGGVAPGGGAAMNMISGRPLIIIEHQQQLLGCLTHSGSVVAPHTLRGTSKQSCKRVLLLLLL